MFKGRFSLRALRRLKGGSHDGKEDDSCRGRLGPFRRHDLLDRPENLSGAVHQAWLGAAGADCNGTRQAPHPHAGLAEGAGRRWCHSEFQSSARGQSRLPIGGLFFEHGRRCGRSPEILAASQGGGDGSHHPRDFRGNRRLLVHFPAGHNRWNLDGHRRREQPAQRIFSVVDLSVSLRRPVLSAVGAHTVVAEARGPCEPSQGLPTPVAARFGQSRRVREPYPFFSSAAPQSHGRGFGPGSPRSSQHACRSVDRHGRGWNAAGLLALVRD